MRPVRLRFATQVAGLLSCLLLMLGFGQPAAARTKPAARHRHVRLPRVLPTIIPAASEGYDVVLRGRASWYAPCFHGRRTSSGERYSRREFTCAHKTLPFGTRLRVTNVSNGKTVVVRVTDRGPFRHHRILDLSERAARPLGICNAGAVTVVAVVVPAETLLGFADTPDNLAALTAADPRPGAPFTAYLLPILQRSAELVAAVTPASAPGPAAGRYEVQAGTFAADDWQAEATLARIQALAPELAAHLEPTEAAGRRARRVVIGRLDSWLTAEAVRRNLQLWGLTGQVRALPEPTATLASTLPPANGQ